MNSRIQLLSALAWLLMGVALITTPAGLSLLEGVGDDLETLFRMLPRPQHQLREAQDMVAATRLQRMMALSVVAMFSGVGIAAFVARTVYRERWHRFIRGLRNVTERGSRRTSSVTLADEMAAQYERSMSRSSLVLFMALALSVLAAWTYPGRAILSGALGRGRTAR
jgi:hypothetical protein